MERIRKEVFVSCHMSAGTEENHENFISLGAYRQRFEMRIS
jgi:hypothetical protein